MPKSTFSCPFIQSMATSYWKLPGFLRRPVACVSRSLVRVAKQKQAQVYCTEGTERSSLSPHHPAKNLITLPAKLRSGTAGICWEKSGNKHHGTVANECHRRQLAAEPRVSLLFSTLETNSRNKQAGNKNPEEAGCLPSATSLPSVDALLPLVLSAPPTLHDFCPRTHTWPHFHHRFPVLHQSPSDSFPLFRSELHPLLLTCPNL